MEHLINFLHGAASAVSIVPTPRSYHVERCGFEKDAENLRADFRAVAKDLRQAVKHEQTDYRAR